MEERLTLARPYAVAAFKQAREEGDLDRWSEMLKLLRRIAQEPAMSAVLSDPRVERQRLSDFVLEVCGDALTDSGRNFVRILAEYRRMALLPEIAMLFERQRAGHEGRSNIEVVSAFELEPRFEEAITEAMSNRLGTAVELTKRVDPAIIGGVLIRAGDLVIDLSLRGRLNQLALALA